MVKLVGERRSHADRWFLIDCGGCRLAVEERRAKFRWLPTCRGREKRGDGFWFSERERAARFSRLGH